MNQVVGMGLASLGHLITQRNSWSVGAGLCYLKFGALHI